MTTFEKKCNAAADHAGVEVGFVFDAGERRAFEDDGCLHIVSGRGQRAMFSLNQDDPAWSNKKTRLILTTLKMDKFIGESTLADEEDEKEECCPHCGCDCQY